MLILMSDPVQPPIWTHHRSDTIPVVRISHPCTLHSQEAFLTATGVVTLAVSTKTTLNEHERECLYISLSTLML